ncbi:MAG: chromate transporter [Bacteroidaceae bacterium]|nr:chromate transporter [Bacteroidaceae bacterium]
MFEMFFTFMRIGLFTIGGGYAMIPLIEEQVVRRKAWVSAEELIDLIAVAQSCPGIFAVNISIFIGYRRRGTLGALACTLGAVLPSFIIILAIALVFRQFRDNEIVERIFRGIRPAVVALIAAPVFRMAKSAKVNRYNVWIPVVAAIAIWLLGVSPIYVIMLAGIGGYVYGQYIKE